jgi:hypothetical protein
MAVAMAIVLSWSGCYYDNEEELYPPPPAPDTSVVVKYTTDVEPLLRQNCYACHSTATHQTMGKVNLEGYANTKTAAQTPRFVSCLKWEQGCNMPPAERMPAEQIRTIEHWIATGMPE